VSPLLQGIFSSLQPQNIRNRRAIVDPEAFAGDPRYPLLFDPQTAGGLLAAVPSERAAECVAALKHAGYVAAAVVGEITELPEGTEELIELRP
jgi:selenide,water dikinase